MSASNKDFRLQKSHFSVSSRAYKRPYFQPKFWVRWLWKNCTKQSTLWVQIIKWFGTGFEFRNYGFCKQSTLLHIQIDELISNQSLEFTGFEKKSTKQSTLWIQIIKWFGPVFLGSDITDSASKACFCIFK